MKYIITAIAKEVKPEGQLSGLVLAGFLCSVFGLLLLLIFGFPFFLGTLGVIFSAIGLGQTSRGRTGKGFAIAGLIIILDILLFWLLVIIIASIAAAIAF